MDPVYAIREQMPVMDASPSHLLLFVCARCVSSGLAATFGICCPTTLYVNEVMFRNSVECKATQAMNDCYCTGLSRASTIVQQWIVRPDDLSARAAATTTGCASSGTTTAAK